MRVPGPRLLLMLLLLLLRCWLRLQSAVSENSTLEVKRGENKTCSHQKPCCQRRLSGTGKVRMQAFLSGKKRVCKTSKAHVGPKKATILSLKKQLLKGNSGIFKPGPYINMFCCVNASDIAWFLKISQLIAAVLPKKKPRSETSRGKLLQIFLNLDC